MSTPSTAAPRTIETLKAAIAGRVFVPGEAGSFRRLQKIKAAHDPGQVIISAQATSMLNLNERPKHPPAPARRARHTTTAALAGPGVRPDMGRAAAGPGGDRDLG